MFQSEAWRNHSASDRLSDVLLSELMCTTPKDENTKCSELTLSFLTDIKS